MWTSNLESYQSEDEEAALTSSLQETVRKDREGKEEKDKQNGGETSAQRIDGIPEGDEKDKDANKKNAEESQIHAALCIEFSLASSTYATMCLRELMKISTSSEDMKQRNTFNNM